MKPSIRYRRFFLIVFFPSFSHSQEPNKIPLYPQHIGIEFGAPVPYIIDLSRGENNRILDLPITYLNYENRVKNKFWWEGGMAFGLSINNSSYSPGTTYKSVSANAHTGALYKVKVFRDFYFTPSIDFYYSVLKHSITDSQTITTINNIFSIGPTIGFEYYFSDRISVNTDVINLNYGLLFSTDDQASGSLFNHHGTFSVYKGLSLGLHYSFNIRNKR